MLGREKISPHGGEKFLISKIRGEKKEHWKFSVIENFSQQSLLEKKYSGRAD